MPSPRRSSFEDLPRPLPSACSGFSNVDAHPHPFAVQAFRQRSDIRDLGILVIQSIS